MAPNQSSQRRPHQYLAPGQAGGHQHPELCCANVWAVCSQRAITVAPAGVAPASSYSQLNFHILNVCVVYVQDPVTVAPAVVTPTVVTKEVKAPKVKTVKEKDPKVVYVKVRARPPPPLRTRDCDRT